MYMTGVAEHQRYKHWKQNKGKIKANYTFTLSFYLYDFQLCHIDAKSTLNHIKYKKSNKVENYFEVFSELVSSQKLV